MDTIYLVTFGTYLEDVLEGFATNEEEIRQIILNNSTSEYRYVDVEKLVVEIDLEAGTAVVEDEYRTIYSIHTIKRVSG